MANPAERGISKKKSTCRTDLKKKNLPLSEGKEGDQKKKNSERKKKKGRNWGNRAVTCAHKRTSDRNERR